MSPISVLPPDGDFLMYTTEDGQARLEVRLNGETVWLSLTQLAELFQRDKSVISRHIKNVFDEGELVADSVVANFATTIYAVSLVLGLDACEQPKPRPSRWDR